MYFRPKVLKRCRFYADFCDFLEISPYGAYTAPVQHNRVLEGQKFIILGTFFEEACHNTFQEHFFTILG